MKEQIIVAILFLIFGIVGTWLSMYTPIDF